MSDAQIYDTQNYLLEAQQTPPLVPVNPSFDNNETPPPIATRDSSLEPSEEDEDEAPGGPPRRGDEETPPKADHVLLRQLGPNYLETANYGLKQYIGTSTGVQEEAYAMTVVALAQNGDTRDGSSAHNGKEATLEDDEGFVMIDAISKGAVNGQVIGNSMHTSEAETVLKSLDPAFPLRPTNAALDVRPPPSLDVKPPPRPPPILTSGSTTRPVQRPLEEDTLAKSPALARFTINRADGDPCNTLPAMQMSPPRSASNGSPESKQTLPSLTTALSDAGTPFTAHSPNFPRASPGQTSQYGPSPHSGMSPPSLPNPPFWRTSTREGSISTPSDYAIVSASGSIPTPASSILNPSPAASHHTPIAASPDRIRLDSSVEQVLSPESDGQETNGIGGPFAGSNYKCSIPGCTAAPFQTQYLLNSHMNVHSDTRPHFCPVKNCARGPGGQGFKRKNEMIRYAQSSLALFLSNSLPDAFSFVRALY